MTQDRRTPPAPQHAARPTEQEMWSEELREFMVDRFGLVQTAARFWLGTTTTLVALFSAILVVNRGEALAALQVGTFVRVVVYVLVVFVYLSAFGAVVLGSQACFGRLSVRIQPKEKGPLKALKQQLFPAPMPTPPELTWKAFRKDRQGRANKARRYLHQSRALGVLAVGAAIALALVVLAVGGFSDDPLDPTHVVVIHEGQLVCGELDQASDGRVLVDGDELKDVSHLTVVDDC